MDQVRTGSAQVRVDQVKVDRVRIESEWIGSGPGQDQSGPVRVDGSGMGQDWIRTGSGSVRVDRVRVDRVRTGQVEPGQG